MKKGDGRWSHLKVILGFLFDGRRRSVQLPQDKLNKYLGELERMLEKTRVPLQKFRKVVGKLCHSAAILPPGLGLFSPISKALKAADIQQIGRASCSYMLSRTAMTSIYSVFPPPKEIGHVNGRDPVSKKEDEKRIRKMVTS